MTPLIHNYSGMAGKTVYWDTSDNENTYQKNLQDSEKKQLLEKMGYLDNPIIYQFNSHGFRTAEFNDHYDAVCFGCSFTMGTGVHHEHTWPSQLASMANLKIANLAHAGSSNDTAYRMADYYLKFLRPKYALWLQTDLHRLEIINEHDKISVNILASDSDDWYSNNFFIKTWMTSDTNQRLNLTKNTRAFVNLCQELDIKPVILLRSEVKREDLARDLMHPGQGSYKKIANKFKTLLNL